MAANWQPFLFSYLPYQKVNITKRPTWLIHQISRDNIVVTIYDVLNVSYFLLKNVKPFLEPRSCN